MKTKNILEQLNHPILFRGDETIAYGDPAVLYLNGLFYTKAKKHDKPFCYASETRALLILDVMFQRNQKIKVLKWN